MWQMGLIPSLPGIYKKTNKNHLLRYRSGGDALQSQMIKIFLVLFFKKAHASLLFLFFSALAWPNAAWCARLVLSAKPASVTLYDDRATVERRGVLDLPAGDNVIVIGGVPGGLLPDSLTARGQSDGAGITIGAVETRPVFDTEAANARRAALDQRLLEIDDEIAVVDARAAGFAAQRTLIGHLSEAPAGTAASPGLPDDPAKWQSAWSALRDGAREASDGIYKAQAEKRALQEQRARLAAEATAAGKPPALREIDVAVHADAAAQFTLSVSYQVGNARWHPVYEARLDSAAARLTLLQSAVVSEATGEDWENVALTLSTARPGGGTAPPPLSPWRISLASPNPPAPAIAAVMAPVISPAPLAAPRMQREDAAARREAEVETASLQANGLALDYAIAGASTIRADGSAQMVRIAASMLPATLGVQTVPRLDPKAYLSARFGLDAQAGPILPGEVALYLDGLFVGRSHLNLLHPGETTALSFGVDDHVKVAYAPQQNKRAQDGGLFSKRNVSTVAALITVQNFHAMPIEITVLDQVPVSADGALKVEMDADPPPDLRDIDDRPGVVEWQSTYQPNEAHRIRFGFRATAPEGREIEGLRQ